MSEKNDKIKIDELLKIAKITNLGQYFNHFSSEISVKGLSKRLYKKIRGREYHEHLIEGVFSLVDYIWKSYQNLKDSFKLGNNEI